MGEPFDWQLEFGNASKAPQNNDPEFIHKRELTGKTFQVILLYRGK